MISKQAQKKCSQHSFKDKYPEEPEEWYVVRSRDRGEAMLIQMMTELQHFKITDILNLGGREKL